MKHLFILVLFFWVNVAAQKTTPNYVAQIEPFTFAQSRVMMHDVVNPPAACRYYAYGMLGAYAIVAQQNKTIPKTEAFIKNFTAVTFKPITPYYNYKIAALYCILETGKLMLPSGYMIQDDENEFVKQLLLQKVPQASIDASVAVAKDVATQIINFSKADGYNKLSARVRYTPQKGEEYYYPTPPLYLDAIEPNWKTIRPLYLDSASQFKPVPPTKFSKDSSSAFYKLAKEVYDFGAHPTQEQLAIASFWDCNPFAVQTSGHMAIGYKKISPGGHWMGIGNIAAIKAKLNFDQYIAMETYLATAMMDAFISCWEEKYRSNRIRPETYIVRYIDDKWQPLLQTPPFPEYTSGHSVLSTAAAAVLTYLLGDHFAYTDNSEHMFDLADRHFKSFYHAASEASISRIYGGIHYRDAVEAGQTEGKYLGEFVVKQLQSAGLMPFKNGKKPLLRP